MKGDTRISGFFEKIIVANPLQKYTAPYEARLRSSPFYATPLHAPYLRPTLILSFHLLLNLQLDLFL